MSNVIPPMLSSSPPPVDIRDDEEDEDEFSDFRVADFALTLSDVIIGDDNLDKLKSPLTEEPSIPIPQSPAHGKFPTPFELPPEVDDTLDVISDNEEQPPEVETSSIKENCDGLVKDEKKEDKQKERDRTVEELRPLELDDDTTTEEEIANIPFPHVYSPCGTPPENELRTSPEGADSEDVCGEESSFSWNVSLSDGCELKSTVNQSSDCTIANLDKAINELSDYPGASKIDDFGDFSDFADFSTQPFPADSTAFLGASPVNKEHIPVSSLDDSIEDDFDGFESAAPTSIKEENVDDNSPSTIPSSIAPKSDTVNFDDEFDDFESAAPVDDAPNVGVEKLTDRVSELFPCAPLEVEEDPALTNCLNSCLDDSSSVWGCLKDLDASHALKLQWSSSTASNKLLSSLNIDSRNILIGSRWNGSVPRFAANLSVAPLEPVKAEASTNHVPTIARLHSTVVEDVVPAAQFDWNGSGLTNPLDCAEKNENANGNPPELITDSSPSRLPEDNLWSSSGIPSTDVLLPAPAEPHQIQLDTMLIKQLTTDSNKPGTDVELEIALESSWSTNNGFSEQAKEEPTNLLNIAGSTPSWNISSQLEQRRSDQVARPQLSAEACRVVETLPDLSFLSARKLLYAANENMGRFHSRQQL